MTQEEKELLTRDLCNRFPYNVKGIITFNGDKDIFTVKGIFNILFLSNNECCHFEDFKPYLFPLSSMTEAQKKELQALIRPTFGTSYNTFTPQDFYCKYHLDYRGLIEMGLAIDATGLGIYE